MSVLKTYHFSRKEHLKSAKDIALLFTKGNSVNSFPLRFQYILVSEKDLHESEPEMKIAFTVPKRKFRKAVDRNRIKRQMIEIFRLNRENLLAELQNKQIHLQMMIVYNGDKFPIYNKLEKRMKSGINKLCAKF